MTRAEYDSLRSRFFQLAREQGFSVGNDEAGYNDDEPVAAVIWKQWLDAASSAHRNSTWATTRPTPWI